MSSSIGQESISIINNSRPIKKDRYEHIDGSPYLFNEFISLDIVSRDGYLHQNLYGNYNGHKEKLEVIFNGEIISLASEWITIIRFYPDFNLENGLIMVKGGHPKHTDQFAILLHRGEHISFIKEFKISLSEVRNRDVDKKILKKTFLPTELYYILKKDKIQKVLLTKKSVLKHLNKSKSLDDYILENTIDFKKEKDIVKLLEFYEKLEGTSN